MKRKEEVIPIITTIIVHGSISNAKSVTDIELVAEMKKELKVARFNDILIYYYGMNKDDINNARKHNLITLFTDKVATSQRKSAGDDNWWIMSKYNGAKAL